MDPKTHVDLLIRSFGRDDDGQGLAEYALILALIAIDRHHRPHLPGQSGQHDPEHRGPLRLDRVMPHVNSAPAVSGPSRMLA